MTGVKTCALPIFITSVVCYTNTEVNSYMLVVLVAYFTDSYVKDQLKNQTLLLSTIYTTTSTEYASCIQHGVNEVNIW